MIVKVQVSKYDSEGVRRVLVFDRPRDIVFEGPVSPEDVVELTDQLESFRRQTGSAMGSIDLSYWLAEVDSEGKIAIDHPVSLEDW